MDQQLLAEQQDFTFIKEKIIKTNELLLLYNEKNEKLGRATQAFKSLKAKYEVALLEADSLKGANERLIDSLKVLKPKCENADKEIAAARLEYSKLEEKYQQYLIETQLITTELQDKVKQCICNKDLFLSPSRRKTTDEVIRELKQTCKDLKTEEHKLRMENNSLTRKNKLFEAASKNTDLKKELAKVNNQLQKAELSLKNHQNEHKIELNQLKMEISKLLLENTKMKLLENECNALKEQLHHKSTNKCDFASQTEHVFEKHICKASSVVPLNTGDKGEEINDIQTIREMDDDSLDMDISFSDIFREMILPRTIVSPMKLSPEVSVPNKEISTLPNIIVTPPTPNLESNNNLTMKFPQLTDLPEENCKIADRAIENIKESVDVGDNKKSASTEAKNVKKSRPVRRKYWMPYAINTYVKRKSIKTTRTLKNDTILDALRILQQNNINFTISSNSIPLEPTYDYPPNTFTYKMDCFNKSCNTKNNLMMLKMTSQHEEPELLGFFSVKDEKIVPSINETILEEKPQKSDLHQLAEQIIKGIKELTNEKQNNYKRKRHRGSEFKSETESELERLFRGTNNVLGRNRRLMAVARKQNLESRSVLESDSDFMVDSGLVTATPKNDSDSLVSVLDILEPPQVNKQIITENSYKITPCPLMISPLSVSTKSSPEEIRKVNESTGLEQLYFTDQCCIDTGQVKKPSFGQKITFEGSSRENEASLPLLVKESCKKLSENDLFGELSLSDNSDDEEIELVTPKPISSTQKKPSALKSKILKQVKGLVYAYGNKDCDKSSCAKPKSLDVISNKKINVVQDIVISKGSLPAPRKRLKLDISAAKTTPVDILSQVMQDMTKIGPKKQKPSMLPVPSSVEVPKPIYCDLDCPKSPDIVEIPDDRLPKLIPTEKPKVLAPCKVINLMDKLMVFCNEEKVLDEVLQEFAFQDVDYIVRILLSKLSKDIHEKPTRAFEGKPPMTNTQRVLLGFLVKLDKSTHPGILDRFLTVSELLLHNKTTCELHNLQPVTRFYTVICRMRMDLHRIRRFVCESFYFAGDYAVPIFYTVLVVWPDVLPLHSDVSKFPLAKVLVQLSYLKQCNTPGYNLLPLRNLLHRYYGYPTERWNCEEVFEEILANYIQNPSVRLSDFTMLLYLKNQSAKWVHEKINRIIRPLYERVPENNPNLKATLVILMANICFAFNKHDELEGLLIKKMDEWFRQLQEVETNPIVQNSLQLARSRLPKMPKKKKIKPKEVRKGSDMDQKLES